MLANEIASWLIGIILFLSIFFNLISTKHSNHRRHQICIIHNRKIMLRINKKNYDITDDLYVSKNHLLMHNSGTKIEQSNKKVKFVLLASPDDFYL